MNLSKTCSINQYMKLTKFAASQNTNIIVKIQFRMYTLAKFSNCYCNKTKIAVIFFFLQKNGNCD